MGGENGGCLGRSSEPEFSMTVALLGVTLDDRLPESRYIPICPQPHDFLWILIVLERNASQIVRAAFLVAS
jgi:hypothetical protein